MLSDELRKEISKWSDRLDVKIPKVKSMDKSGDELLENAEAYRKDSEYFLKNNDLIESFESLIWAWALIEIGEDLNHLKSAPAP